MTIIKKFLIIFSSLFILLGCATTNFSTEKTPVTITEEFVRQGAITWRGTRILGINGKNLGAQTMATTFTFNSGPTKLLIAYRENRGELNLNTKFYDTHPIVIEVDLQPSNHYLLKATAKTDSVFFDLIDQTLNKSVYTSNEVPIIYKSSNLPNESLIKK